LIRQSMLTFSLFFGTAPIRGDSAWTTGSSPVATS